MRGKPPGIAKTLAQRLAGMNKRLWKIEIFTIYVLEKNQEDPVICQKHDIGFPFLKQSRSEELRQRLDHLKERRGDQSLEKLARSQKRKITHDTVQL